MALDACLKKIVSFQRHQPFETQLPEAPYALLVRHVALYKNNLYGFHLADTTRDGDIDFFAQHYASLFAMEITATFSRLQPRQHRAVERALANRVDDDDSNGDELAHLYGRWRLLNA